MLLYDRLRAAIPALPDDIPVIDATSIQQRIDLLPEGLPQPTAADYGTVAPPFPSFFVEATSRSTLPAEGEQVVQRGVMFHSWDITELGGIPPRYRSIPQLSGAAWCLIGWGYIHYQSTLFATPSCFVLQIGRDGALLDDTYRIQLAIDPPILGAHLPATPHNTIASLAPFTLTAISALHRRCEAELVTPTRQQRRQAARDGRPQPSTHYVIHVRPGAVRRISDIARRPASTGGRSDYGARGHFKYYHPDRPRFGRPGEHGLFWVNPRTGKDDPITKMKRVYKIEDYR